MSRKHDSAHSSERHTGGNSLLTGILVGTLVGVCLAGGVAWYLMKSPAPYTNNPAKPEAVKSATSSAAKTPATAEKEKPRFEFYKVLTDKETNVNSLAQPDKSQPPKSGKTDSKPAVAYEPQILQAGSFPSVNDAENLKAKLALIGIEANIQTAAIPDKGQWYRVRVGPYKNLVEMNHARNFMKQNGVESTPMRAQ